MPCKFGDDPDWQPVGFNGSADQILDINDQAPYMGLEVDQKRFKMLRRHPLVVVPPDMRFGGGVAHDELVLGRAASVLARFGGKCTVSRQSRFAATDGLFAEISL